MRYVTSSKASDGYPCFVFEVSRPCTVREALLSLGMSKAAVGRLFARGQLSIGGLVTARSDRPPAPHTELSIGDLLQVESRPVLSEGGLCGESALRRAAGAARVRTLYEDPFVVAVDKPAGLLVHGDGTGAPTLNDAVAVRCGRAGTCVQAVQRLDVDTTGVVLFSKTPEFQGLFDALVAQKGGRGIEKVYLAIVRGRLSFGRTVLDGPIARDRHDARRMRVAAKGGQEALTEVLCLGSSWDGEHSLVLVRLGTGRRHQIRVHLAACGHPVANDPLYGTVETSSGLMLHAYRERFEHPVSGESVDICSGWPSRFDVWFDRETWQPHVLAAFAGDCARGPGADGV